jgi:holo-[acyl-carrier protein] synthase
VKDRRAKAGTGVPGVAGIGIDLVETDRLKRTLARWKDRFLDRVFTESERSYCDSQAAPWRHYAGRFAVKEAVSKAFGTGIGVHIDWLDIEVRRDADTGAPSVLLHGRAARLAARRGVTRVLASLSHSRSHAVAQALLVSGDRVVSKKKT